MHSSQLNVIRKVTGVITLKNTFVRPMFCWVAFKFQNSDFDDDNVTSARERACSRDGIVVVSANISQSLLIFYWIKFTKKHAIKAIKFSTWSRWPSWPFHRPWDTLPPGPRGFASRAWCPRVPGTMTGQEGHLDLVENLIT